MKRVSLLLLFVAVVMAACNSFGEKYQVNDKSEVYYKGEGVTAEDAKRLGDFLLSNNYFDSLTEKSVQLTRTADTFNVKFVVDQEKVNQNQDSDMLFTIVGAAISTEVFGGRPVKVLMADERMNTFREFPTFNAGSFDAESMDPTPTTTGADTTAPGN